MNSRKSSTGEENKHASAIFTYGDPTSFSHVQGCHGLSGALEAYYAHRHQGVGFTVVTR